MHPLIDNPVEAPLWLAVLSTVGYIIRHWFQSRKYRVNLKELEQKMENDPDNSISIVKNPGRSTVEILDVIHDDLREFKRATNARLDTLTSDVGYLKGRINGGK